MVFRSEADKAWLKRRFAMLKDDLREYSWTFRETLEEGRVEEARNHIEAFVQARFPALLASVKSRIAAMTDLEKLRSFLLTVGLAQTEKEVTKALAAL
jgi:hypothetical protein